MTACSGKLWQVRLNDGLGIFELKAHMKLAIEDAFNLHSMRFRAENLEAYRFVQPDCTRIFCVHTKVHLRNPGDTTRE